jgi:integrase
MPKFSKGIKVRYVEGRGLWRVDCHVAGERWCGGSDRDKGRAIEIAQDLERRLRAKEDIRPPEKRAATPADVKPGTVRDIGARWLIDQAGTHANNSTEHYDWALGHIYALIGDVPMDDDHLTRKVCKGLAKALIGRPLQKGTGTLSFASRDAICVVLSILCKWARDEDDIPLNSNPAEDLKDFIVDPHELDRAIPVWDHQQAAAILEVTKARNPEWYLPLKFALLTGVRSGELREVRDTDLKIAPSGTEPGRLFLDRQYLSRSRKKWTLGAGGQRVREVTALSRVSKLKGRQARTLDVLAELWAELQAEVKANRAKFLKLGRPNAEDQALLFTNRRGTRINVEAFKKQVLPKICRLAGVPVTKRFHVTRHTFATVLLMSGEDPDYVSTQLGHKNTSTTEKTYKHWLPDGRRAIGRSARIQAAWGFKQGKG